MSLDALCAVLAFGCFLAGGFGVDARVNFMCLGFAALTLTLLV